MVEELYPNKKFNQISGYNHLFDHDIVFYGFTILLYFFIGYIGVSIGFLVLELMHYLVWDVHYHEIDTNWYSIFDFYLLIFEIIVIQLLSNWKYTRRIKGQIMITIALSHLLWNILFMMPIVRFYSSLYVIYVLIIPFILIYFGKSQFKMNGPFYRHNRDLKLFYNILDFGLIPTISIIIVINLMDLPHIYKYYLY